jgi:hypothetical protein
MFEQLKALVNSPSVEDEFLRHPLSYDLMAEIGKRVYNRRGKCAQGIWLDFISRQIKAGLKRRGLVVWGNAFFPFELLYGLGVTPGIGLLFAGHLLILPLHYGVGYSEPAAGA